MLRENANAFIELGQLLFDARYLFENEENFVQWPNGEKTLSEIGEQQVSAELTRFIDLAKRLKLPTSLAILEQYSRERLAMPRTAREFDLIVNVLTKELESRIF